MCRKEGGKRRTRRRTNRVGEIMKKPWMVVVRDID